MKKIGIVLLVAAGILTMGSCGNKSEKVPFDNGDSLGIDVDSTLYGICGEATSMNMLQMITDTGDTLMLDISAAKENDQVFGGLQVGDRMAVITNRDKTEAVLVINQATLLGNWVMPNPIDGSDEVGFRIKEGGIAESIEQSDLVYKTWRLIRGQLEVVMMRESGSGEDETMLYDIVKLGPDSLTLKDAEETLEYSRQKPREEYGKDVKLEDASADDYQI